MEPVDTLITRTGVCRDTAMLYLEACRSLGFAARFLSGIYRGTGVGSSMHYLVDVRSAVSLEEL